MVSIFLSFPHSPPTPTNPPPIAYKPRRAAAWFETEPGPALAPHRTTRDMYVCAPWVCCTFISGGVAPHGKKPSESATRNAPTPAQLASLSLLLESQQSTGDAHNSCTRIRPYTITAEQSAQDHLKAGNTETHQSRDSVRAFTTHRNPRGLKSPPNPAASSAVLHGTLQPARQQPHQPKLPRRR